ncbi:MAG: tRNA (guanine(37)-N1)-methyltransferase [Trebouxia sp. A1-2]|nr:MAG: tRNA (guanine(37)-N1)-methyltransferase [Trebouxia sp. A1-2]
MLLKAALSGRAPPSHSLRCLSAAHELSGWGLQLHPYHHVRQLINGRLIPIRNMSDAQAASTPGRPFDKSEFSQTLTLRALKVQAKQCQGLMKSFAGYTLNKPRTRCIVSDEGSSTTRLLLLTDEHLVDMIQAEDLAVTDYTLQIGYDQLSAEDIIRKVVPQDVREVPHAFESVGHIAHLNLRDELLPYKHIIGQVVLDKNPSIKTVVNKVGNIENEYRVFQMDVIAGKPILETEVKQHSARFKLDYSQVYWNSRLETEHKRLVDSFRPGEVVLDVMAGIGPFAIPAAQKGCTVLANDLNPNSFKYLEQNIKLNKVSSKVTAFNMDGRSFIRQQCNPSARGAQPQDRTDAEPAQPSGAADASLQPALTAAFDHAIMNLPASAIEFLDAFHGAFDSRAHVEAQLPLVHCYCFQRKDESHADVQQRVETALGGTLDGNLSIHDVRLVAPNKRMLCLTFRIPAAVAFAKTSPPSESVATTGKPLFEDKSGNAADSDVLQHSKRQRA